MTIINILEEYKTDNGWRFHVAVTEGKETREYDVQFDNDYYHKVTDGAVSPSILVETSFRFLLDREPKESILPSFTLEQISNYFPEYEREVQKLW